MARQTDGATQYLNSASTINLSTYTKISLSFWSWWDTFGTDDKEVLELGNAPNGGFSLDPNAGGGTWAAFTYDTAFSNLAQGTVTRPSAAAWHHIVVSYDRAAGGSGAEVIAIYFDGSSQTVTRSGAATVGNFANDTLWVMRDGANTKFSAGRIAEIAVYGGLNLSGTEVSALYNSGNGALATDVRNSELKFYWRLLGTTSPEPNTVGGIDMTVNGATSVAHPFNLNPVGGVASPFFRIKRPRWG